ncbi:MAG: helix-turn-helix domain-containing protein [Thermoplasmata archaeon]
MSRKDNSYSASGMLSELFDRISDLSSELRKVGLTEYESRCYLATVALDGGKAEEIAELASVPRTSAYKALDSLVARGFIEQSEARPMIFLPVDTLTLKGRLTGDIESTFESIIQLQEDLAHKGHPQVVYMMSGRERVLKRIEEMIERARDRVVISSPNIAVLRKQLGKLLDRIIDRGVQVSIIAPPFVRLPRCTSSVRRRALIATDVVVDGEEALIASADLTACGFTDNALIAAHLETFLDLVMSQEWKGEAI